MGFPLRGRRERVCFDRVLEAAGKLDAVTRVTGALAAGAWSGWRGLSRGWRGPVWGSSALEFRRIGGRGAAGANPRRGNDATPRAG